MSEYYSDEFLIECLKQLKADNFTYGRGVNRFDKEKLDLTISIYNLRPKYAKRWEHMRMYWIDMKHLFKYREQLEHLIKANDYRNQTKGW